MNGLWILSAIIIVVFVILPIVLDLLCKRYEWELFGNYDEEGK